MLQQKKLSLYRLIFRRFLRQSITPFLLIFALFLALFLLNNYQSDTNKKALKQVATRSFEEIANQTSQVINQRFTYDKLRLYQLRDTFELLLKHKEAFVLDASHFKEHGGFFIYNDPDASNPFEAMTYTTNLLELHDTDRLYLSLLHYFEQSIAHTVEEKNDLISSAWVNIDKRYALAYPPIVPIDELIPELDVTEYTFYYSADPAHNPSRDIVYLPLYQEAWAMDAGELGAFLIPLYDNDKFLGVIGLTLKVSGIADTLAHLSLPFDAYAQLLDAQGHLIATSDEAQSFKDYGQHSFYELHRNLELEDRVLKKINTVTTATDSTHYRRSIEETGLILNIQAKNSTIFETIVQLHHQVFVIIIALLATIVLIYGMVFIKGINRIKALARQLSNYLSQVVEFSSQLGRAEELKLPPSTIEEFDMLGIQLKQTHQTLLELLSKDPQTGLFNRQKLLETLETVPSLSLMIFRIQNYQSLFNLYGHSATDGLILAIRDDLLNDTLITPYRTGEDEFAVVFKGDGTEHFTKIYERIQNQTFKYGPISIRPQLSWGMALQAALFERAYLSLLAAKQHTAQHTVTCKEIDTIKASFEHNLERSNHFNQALKENRLLPYFQAIYNVKTKRVEKFEALVRLKENGAVLAPAEFLQVAINMNKGFEITRIMIQKVFAVAQRYAALEFSINISFRDFTAFDLPHYIDETQHAYGIEPERITFELLESDGIEESEPIIKAVAKLKSKGYKIAIDDFGFGHSNFADLVMMQADYIKIDGECIKSIAKDPSSATIARTIARFASLIGAQSIAKYVCDEQVFKRVEAFEIDYAQGYLFSEPVPSEAISQVIETF